MQNHKSTNIATGVASTTHCDADASPVLDPVLSRKLDQVLIELEADPRSMRRLWLRLRKRILERQVPKWPV